jgi:hypothetical protein
VTPTASLVPAETATASPTVSIEEEAGVGRPGITSKKLWPLWIGLAAALLLLILFVISWVIMHNRESATSTEKEMAMPTTGLGYPDRKLSKPFEIPEDESYLSQENPIYEGGVSDDPSEIYVDDEDEDPDATPLYQPDADDGAEEDQAS